MLTDSTGRKWKFTVTIASIKGYEERTGVKVFAHLFELWKKHRAAGVDRLEIMLAIIADLFPGIEEAAAFAFECAIADDENDKPSFDDWCASVSPIELAQTVAGLTEKLQEFMPEKPNLKKSGGGPLDR